MTWRVVTGDAAWSDIEGLTDAEWAAVASGLVAWVDTGPPRSQRRVVGGVELFEDEIAPGCRATYLVNEAEAYVAVVRVRSIRRYAVSAITTSASTTITSRIGSQNP